MRCIICDAIVYDEFMLIDGMDDKPICLNCDDEETISLWKEERN